ncbi:MAG: hydroxyisourate hydrolase [Chloroflexi bacterium]|nr:hydroxyisourate hydrolase [Chloroflexota bacterium]
MSGRLTTHVLDTAHGRPAAGMRLELWQLNAAGERRLVTSVVTNTDGRTDSPLLDGNLQQGEYELVFHVGSYFLAHGEQITSPAFLGQVPVRFGVADPNGHYHVPLLTSPWAYSTYRGS